MNNIRVSSDLVDKWYRDETEKSRVQKIQKKGLFDVSAESDIVNFCNCVGKLKNKLNLGTAMFDCGKYIFIVGNWIPDNFMDFLASIEVKVKSREEVVKQFFFIKKRVPIEQFVIRLNYSHSKDRPQAFICSGSKFNKKKIIIDEKKIVEIISTLKNDFMNSLESKTINVVKKGDSL